jgi:hypothetical protein
MIQDDWDAVCDAYDIPDTSMAPEISKDTKQCEKNEEKANF